MEPPARKLARTGPDETTAGREHRFVGETPLGKFAREGSDIARRKRGRPVAGPYWLCLGFLLAVASGQACAETAPLPPGRPAELGRGGRTPAVTPPPPTPAPVIAPLTPPDGDGGCLDVLRASGVGFEPASQPTAADPACAVANPVRLLSAPDAADPRRAVLLPDRPVVACRFAGPFTQWLSRIAAPVLRASRGQDLKAVRTGPGFECRSRNHQAGAKMSAHALGLALDVAGFDFADGRTLGVKPGGADKAAEDAFASIRTAACGWFLTVLGPGSDPFHTDHLHLDIQQHGSSDRYRICQ